jgi:hypothetical protein
LERGEVGIITVQFAALAVLVILLGNYGNVTGAGPSSAQVNHVYWGATSKGTELKTGGLNTETVNSSTISLYFSLPRGTTIALPVTASRLCLNPSENDTGKVRVYDNISVNWDPTARQNYVQIGPTGQPSGVGCSYTITITDTVGQTATWTDTIKVVPNSTATA